MAASTELAEALLAADAVERPDVLRQASTGDVARAIASLGQRPEPAAAEVLSTIEQFVEDRALRKSARRELHRLRSRGIQPPPISVLRESSPTAGERTPVAVSEAWATDIDPSGSRGLWLLGERPLGGAWFAALLISDLTGLVELALVDTTRKRFQRELDNQRRQRGTWIDLPGDYALGLVREAVEVGRDQGTPPPPRYRGFRESFGEAPGPPDRALVYDTVSAVEATLNPELLAESQALLAETEVMGWHVPLPESLRPRALEVARGPGSALLVPGQEPEHQVLQLLSEVARLSLTPALRRALRRRLEETAYIFARSDRLLAARRAVAAARALQDMGLPPERHPFLRALIEAGLARALRGEQIGQRPAIEVLVELIERAVQGGQREGGRTVARGPGGLILPR
ncbi:MAG: hypothetical protein M3336_13665 [Chloroflexota bacterium]|nr:hypothetical protein [Chloroflexota bacterium]